MSPSLYPQKVHIAPSILMKSYPPVWPSRKSTGTWELNLLMFRVLNAATTTVLSLFTSFTSPQAHLSIDLTSSFLRFQLLLQYEYNDTYCKSMMWPSRKRNNHPYKKMSSNASQLEKLPSGLKRLSSLTNVISPLNPFK